MKQERWRSKVLWAALSAQVLALLVTLGVIDMGLSERLTAVVTAVLEMLVAFGVINSPDNADSL
jgi:Bacteriophage holin.